MRLIPGIKVDVKLDGKKRHFILVAEGGDGNGRLNVKAPLAVLLGGMGPGDEVKAWTPRITGAVAVRVELVAIVS